MASTRDGGGGAGGGRQLVNMNPSLLKPPGLKPTLVNVHPSQPTRQRYSAGVKYGSMRTLNMHPLGYNNAKHGHLDDIDDDIDNDFRGYSRGDWYEEEEELGEEDGVDEETEMDVRAVPSYSFGSRHHGQEVLFEDEDNDEDDEDEEERRRRGGRRGGGALSLAGLDFAAAEALAFSALRGAAEARDGGAALRRVARFIARGELRCSSLRRRLDESMRVASEMHSLVVGSTGDAQRTAHGGAGGGRATDITADEVVALRSRLVSAEEAVTRAQMAAAEAKRREDARETTMRIEAEAKARSLGAALEAAREGAQRAGNDHATLNAALRHEQAAVRSLKGEADAARGEADALRAARSEAIAGREAAEMDLRNAKEQIDEMMRKCSLLQGELRDVKAQGDARLANVAGEVRRGRDQRDKIREERDAETRRVKALEAEASGMCLAVHSECARIHSAAKSHTVSVRRVAKASASLVTLERTVSMLSQLAEKAEHRYATKLKTQEKMMRNAFAMKESAMRERFRKAIHASKATQAQQDAKARQAVCDEIERRLRVMQASHAAEMRERDTDIRRATERIRELETAASRSATEINTLRSARDAVAMRLDTALDDAASMRSRLTASETRHRAHVEEYEHKILSALETQKEHTKHVESMQRREGEMQEQLETAVRIAEEERSGHANERMRLETAKADLEAALHSADMERTVHMSEIARIKADTAALEDALRVAESETDRVTVANASLDSTKTQIESEKKNLESSLRSAEAETKRLQAERSVADRHTATLEKHKLQCEAAVRAAESETARLAAEKATADSTVASLETEKDRLEVKLRASETDIERLSGAQADIDVRLASLESDLRTANAERCALESALRSAASETATLETERVRLEALVRTAEVDRERFEAQSTRLESAVRDALSESTGLSTEVAALSSELERSREEASRLRKRLENEVRRASGSDEQIKSLRDALTASSTDARVSRIALREAQAELATCMESTAALVTATRLMSSRCSTIEARRCIAADACHALHAETTRVGRECDALTSAVADVESTLAPAAAATLAATVERGDIMTIAAGHAATVRAEAKRLGAAIASEARDVVGAVVRQLVASRAREKRLRADVARYEGEVVKEYEAKLFAMQREITQARTRLGTSVAAEAHGAEELARHKNVQREQETMVQTLRSKLTDVSGELAMLKRAATASREQQHERERQEIVQLEYRYRHKSRSIAEAWGGAAGQFARLYVGLLRAGWRNSYRNLVSARAEGVEYALQCTAALEEGHEQFEGFATSAASSLEHYHDDAFVVMSSARVAVQVMRREVEDIRRRTAVKYANGPATSMSIVSAGRINPLFVVNDDDNGDTRQTGHRNARDRPHSKEEEEVIVDATGDAGAQEEHRRGKQPEMAKHESDRNEKNNDDDDDDDSEESSDVTPSRRVQSSVYKAAELHERITARIRSRRERQRSSTKV